MYIYIYLYIIYIIISVYIYASARAIRTTNKITCISVCTYIFIYLNFADSYDSDAETGPGFNTDRKIHWCKCNFANRLQYCNTRRPKVTKHAKTEFSDFYVFCG
jgi:hypothetical protein